MRATVQAGRKRVMLRILKDVSGPSIDKAIRFRLPINCPDRDSLLDGAKQTDVMDAAEKVGLDLWSSEPDYGIRRQDHSPMSLAQSFGYCRTNSRMSARQRAS